MAKRYGKTLRECVVQPLTQHSTVATTTFQGDSCSSPNGYQHACCRPTVFERCSDNNERNR